MWRKLNISDQDVWDAVVTQGLSYQKVAYRFSCSCDTIHRIMVRLGAPQTHRRPRSKSKEEILRAVVKEGLSYREVAAKIHCSYSHIQQVMKRLGLPQTHRQSNRGGLYPRGLSRPRGAVRVYPDNVLRKMAA
jgi:transposase